MKKFGFSILVLLFAGMLAGIASAQGMRELMTITIPFDFVAGNQSLPSGEYYVLGSSVHSLIWIRNLDRKRVTVENTIPFKGLEAAAYSALQFHRYGDTYFLHKIVLAGQDMAKVVLKSTREREVKLASAKPSIVILKTADASTKR
jgi:hypothetical protein